MRSLVWLVVSLFCSTACRTTAPIVTLPAYVPTPLQEPIEQREASSLPPKTAPPAPVEKDQASPFSGIVIDAHLAAKYKLITAERDYLRKVIEIDQMALAKSQHVTNQAFTDMAQRAQRSWWEDNKGTVGFWVGAVLGMGITMLVVYGVHQTTK